MEAGAEVMKQSGPEETQLRPCGCRFGASPGFRPYYSGRPTVCDCCKKVEDTVDVWRNIELLGGRTKKSRTAEDREQLRVCADCMQDWKGLGD